MYVGGNDHCGNRAPTAGNSDRAVEHIGQLFGDGEYLAVLIGHIFEEAEEINFLLVRATHCRAGGLAHDRDNPYVIKFGVVEAVEQVDRAGSTGSGAHADSAGELGVAASLEGGHLLMPCLNKFRLIIGPLPGGEQAVDAVARIAEHLLDAPLAESLQQIVRATVVVIPKPFLLKLSCCAVLRRAAPLDGPQCGRCHPVRSECGS